MMSGAPSDQAQVGGTQQAAIQQEYDNAYSADAVSFHGDVVADRTPDTGSWYGQCWARS